MARKYSIGPSPPTSFPSITLTYQLFSIASFLTSPLLPPFLLLGSASGHRLPSPISSINCPSFSALAPKRTFPFNFQKDCRDDFAFYFNSHSPPEKYFFLSLFSATVLFTSLALIAAKCSIPYGCVKCSPQALWSPEVEEGVSEKCQAFAAAYRSDEDCQAYISSSQHALSFIAKGNDEAWQATCSSLCPKSYPKSVHSLLCFVTASSPTVPLPGSRLRSLLTT